MKKVLYDSLMNTYTKDPDHYKLLFDIKEGRKEIEDFKEDAKAFCQTYYPGETDIDDIDPEPTPDPTPTPDPEPWFGFIRRKRMKLNFIKTSDPSMAKKLRENNFTAVSQEGKIFVFLNDGKEIFSEEEKKKITYSNILCT